MSEGMLHDGVIGFMFAGHETTASALTRLLQYLKGSPEVLAMLRAEQDRLASQHGLQLTGDMSLLTISYPLTLSNFSNSCLNSFEIPFLSNHQP